jgi:EAL domain-containing protein (putative c-di-GMP-specific phosphodiesterase class I)
MKKTNLASTTTTLKFIISCEELSLFVPFDGACFGHAMSKAVQYATNDDNISKDLVPISVKFTQSSFQSCITWPKKLGMLMICNLSVQAL